MDNTLKNKRKKYNNKIIKLIKEFHKEFGEDQRFIQMLWTLSVVGNTDRFYEESDVTYHRMQSKILQMKNMRFKIGIPEDSK